MRVEIIMKRDCGQGELKPVKYQVVSTIGQSDNEHVNTFSNLADAEMLFVVTEKRLTPCSDVRLYAVDKQGYANCVIMTIVTLQGQVNKTDRRNEL